MLRVGLCFFAFSVLGILPVTSVLAEVKPSPAPKTSAAPAPPPPLSPPRPKSLPLPPPKEKPVYTLLEAINLALQYNPEILEAQKRIEEAQGEKIVARAGYIPSLTSSGSYQYRETSYATQSGYDPNRTTEDWNVSIRLQQNIYTGQRVRSEVAEAKLQEEIRIYEYQAVVDRIVMEVRLAFYDILQARAAVEVRRQAVDLLEKQFVEQKNAFDAGTAGKLNVFRAEVSLANEMPSLLEAENRLADGKVGLSKLLAVPYLIQENAVPFDIEGNLNYKKMPVDLNDCLAKAELLRPELKAGDLEIKRREKEVTVARSGNLPNVGIFVGYDYYNSPSTITPNDTIGGYTAGVSGTWHIFDGFDTAGRVKAALARVGAARQQRDAIRLTIFQEVRSAYLQLQQAEATVASQVENTTLARESYVLVQAGFAAGVNTQLDVLQGRSDLTNAQLAELNAQALHKAALARLQRAISSQVRLIQDQTSLPPSETEASAKTGAPAKTQPAPAGASKPGQP